LPAVGQSARTYWIEVGQDSARLLQDAKRFLEPATAGLLKTGLLLGQGLVQLTLSILISFFLFRDGLSLAERLTSTVARLGGERGKQLLDVAGKTIRGVVYGIIGTALVQAVMAGIGFIVAGVPGAAVLSLLTFFLSVVPMGPPVVWLPAALWLFHKGSPGWGVFMLVWGVIVSSVDNVVKPWLISQGSDLPFILIFFGVIGGALTFGFIGVFLGPTLLAVGYQLIRTWLATRTASVQPTASLPGAEPIQAESPGTAAQ
jgi:predicted PurR-regulated permease PerM